MPDKSTHLNFAVLYLLESNVNFNYSTFILGTLAPDLVIEQQRDSIDVNEEIRKSHFLDNDKNIGLNKYIKYARFEKNRDMNEKSFLIGYYCHLWFDDYFEKNGKDLINENIDSLEKKKVAKSNMTYYNTENTRDFLNGLEVINNFDSFEGFEHITFEKLYKSYTNYIESTLFVSKHKQTLIEKSKYNNFMNEALSKFIDDTKSVLHCIDM